MNASLDGFQADTPWANFDFEVEGDFNGDGTSETIVVTTNAAGEWWLTADNVAGGVYPGTYTVTESLPFGTYVTTGGTSVDVTVTSGCEMVWADGAAGLGPHDPQHECPAPQLAFGNAYFGSVHGKVFNDLNGNGVQDAGETAFGGATVTLDGPSGPQSMQTAFNGLYWFTDLVAGDYVITSDTLSYFQTSTNEAFVGSGEAVVHKIEPTSPANAVIHGDGSNLRVGLQATAIAGDNERSDSSQAATSGFDYMQFREQIKDIEFVRELSNLAFESFARDYDDSDENGENNQSEDELFELLASESTRITRIGSSTFRQESREQRPPSWRLYDVRMFTYKATPDSLIFSLFNKLTRKWQSTTVRGIWYGTQPQFK